MEKVELKVVRSSNLELLRIIAMLAIVSTHYNYCISDDLMWEYKDQQGVFHWMLSSYGKTGINIFMLISGYFMCTKEITLNKYIKLLAQIYFYNILIGTIFIISGDIPLSMKSLFDIVFPFRTIHQDYFITDFLLFYPLMPFVRVLVTNINKKQHLSLIGIFTLIYVVYNLPGFSSPVNPIGWFVFIFVIASYIRFYGFPLLEHNKIHWGMLSLISIACILVCVWYFCKTGKYEPLRLTRSLHYPGSVIVSLSVFMYFKNLKLKYNKYINVMGGATFGILLIHSNSEAMRYFLFTKVIDTREIFMDQNYIIPILYIISIFMVCSVIEIIRQKTIERPMLNIISRLFHLRKNV